jgi:uridine monophosphate synthetase
VVLIDREQGGREMLARQGYRVQPVMTLRQLLEHLVANGRLSGPQRDEVLLSLGLI